jgi:HTH-type transcriptional regulator/antitoxin HigA
MATEYPNWIKRPGFYIKEEMDARGWNQRDLAFILGVPEQAVNMIISGKRGISPDMARALGDAFDVNPDLFANLQTDYDMAQAKEPKPSIKLLGQMQANYPVREMINRGWIQNTDAPLLEQQLARFFKVPTSGEIPYMEHAAKKSKYEELNIPPAQLAWLFRAKHIASEMTVPKYSEKDLREAVKQFESLLLAPEEVRSVPRILMECGVRYTIVEKLPNSKIDGVCFWLDKQSPVVGMSTQRDTIDNFWFVLRHEIEHVLQGHGREKEMIDTDVQGQQVDADPEEDIANAAAQSFCIPTDKLESFMRRKHPFYYEKDVIAFARVNQRHPGLVVGQMQRRMNRYDYLARWLVKVRSFVLPGAVRDGWGEIAPVSL